MKIKSIYINLPIENIQATRLFWSKLGFKFNEDFCDDKALCLELNNGTIYSMLLKKDFFETFTNRKIADLNTTQVLIAIEVDSKEKVNEIVQLAIENGGSKYRESADHGWMYYDSFADIDGHQWEVMFTDISLLPK